MPKLQIPERHQAALAAIIGLAPASVQAIRAVFDKAPENQNPVEIANTESSLIPVANVPEIKGIMDALASLYVLKASSESVSLEQFADDICDAMAAVNSDLRLTEAQRPAFKNKMLTILGSARFLMTSKAYDLATDDERIFCDARIITDMRPVFGAQVNDGAQGVVIVHLLKLGYHEGAQRHQAFHLALDGDDLKTLRKVIERAEEKASSLKSKFKETRFFGIS